MSMGSKKHGPSAPVVKGKTSRHPRFAKHDKPVKAKSPRIAPPALKSNATVAMPGTPAEPDYRRNDQALAGILATDTAKVRRPGLNTMANHRMGGMSTSYRPKAEDLVGRDIIAPATTRPNVHAPARVANLPYDPSTYQDTLAASESAGFRERAMSKRSQLLTLGAVGIDRNGPVWLTSDEDEKS